VDSSNSSHRPRGAISSIVAPSLIAELEHERIDDRVIGGGGAITAPASTTPRACSLAARLRAACAQRDVGGAVVAQTTARGMSTACTSPQAFNAFRQK